MWQRTQLLPQLERRKQRKTKQNKRSPTPARRRRPQRRCLCSVLFCFVCMYVSMYVWFECWGSKLERPSAPLLAPQSESCAYLMRVSVKRATAKERGRERAH